MINEYLVRIKKPKTYPLWNGENSFCKMYLTGGMKKKKYHLVEDIEGLEICTMCQNEAKQWVTNE